VIALEDVRDALATRLATTAGLYATRYDGTASVTPAPSVGYVESDFVPATTAAITVGLNSEVERTGLYVVRLYSPTGGGTALDALADAVLAVFPRHLDLAVSGGFVLRVRGDIGPFRGQLTASNAGRSAIAVTVPWRVRSVA
jgi:hypothetical protein